MKRPCRVGRYVNDSYTVQLITDTSVQQDLHNHVITQTAQAFVTSFLTCCLGAHTEHIQGDQTDDPLLDISCILPRYKHSQRCLILVDFEGTLAARLLCNAFASGRHNGQCAWYPPLHRPFSDISGFMVDALELVDSVLDVVCKEAEGTDCLHRYL
jgi:hypothetical protein